MDMSEIIFEDSEFEMNDEDEAWFEECAQELRDNQHSLYYNSYPRCEIGVISFIGMPEDVEITSSFFDDVNTPSSSQEIHSSINIGSPKSNGENSPSTSHEISNSIKIESPKSNEENKPTTSHEISNSAKIGSLYSNAENRPSTSHDIPNCIRFWSLDVNAMNRPSSTSHEIVGHIIHWPPKSNEEVMKESSQMFANNSILSTTHDAIGANELSHMFEDENPFWSQLWHGNEAKKLEDTPLHIDALPGEILIKILGYLSHNELGQAARVSRKWRECSRCPILWKKVDVRLFNLFASQHEQAIKIAKRLPTYATHLKLDFGACRGEEKQLNFFCFLSTLYCRCPHLKTLILFHAELSDTLASVISLCSRFLRSLKVLILRYCEFDCYFSTDKNFSASSIEVLDLQRCQNVFFDEFLFSKMPKLKKLYLNTTDVLDYGYETLHTSFFDRLQVLDMGNMGIDFMIFEAIKYRGSHLTELYLCDAFLEDCHLKIYDSQFPCLQTMCLRRCTSISCMSVVFLVHSLPSLQNLYVDTVIALSLPSLDKCRLGIVKTINSCDMHDQVDYMCE